MNDQWHLLAWTTVIIFSTLVVKKLSHTSRDHQLYQRKFPLFKWLIKPGTLLTGTIPTLVLLFFYEQSSYASYAFSEELSVFIPLLCLPITWQLSLYEYNAFFDHWHVDLRSSIVLLNALIFLHPAFLPFYLALLHFSNGQFTRGHGGFWTFSDKELPVFLLICFFVFQFIRLGIPEVPFLPFLLSLVALTVGHYASAAMAKLRIKGYVQRANLHHLITSSFVVGWGLFKSEKALMRFSGNVARISTLLAVMALIIEALGFAFIYRPEWFVAWLIAALCFHIFVFIISGIFFWKWMCSLALLIYLFQGTGVLATFGSSWIIMAYLAVMSVLFYYSKLVFRPGWITVAYAYRFHFWLESNKGKRVLLTPSFFKPYDMMFSQARFWFLSAKEKRLGSNVGSVQNNEAFSGFNKLSNADQLADFRQKFGQSLYAIDKAELFDHFVKSFIANRLKSSDHVPKRIQPPRHLFYLGDTGNELSGKDSPVKLTIELEEYYFSDSKVKSNGRTLFHEISFDNDIR